MAAATNNLSSYVCDSGTDNRVDMLQRATRAAMGRNEPLPDEVKVSVKCCNCRSCRKMDASELGGEEGDGF